MSRFAIHHSSSPISPTLPTPATSPSGSTSPGPLPAGARTAASGLPQRQTSDAIVALVGDQPITARQLCRAMASEAAACFSLSRDVLQARALDRLVELSLASQVAAERGVRIDEEDVDCALRMLIEELGLSDPPALDAWVDSRGWSPQGLRWELRQQLTWEALLELAQHDRGQPTDDAVPCHPQEAAVRLAGWLVDRRRGLRIQYWPGRVEAFCGA